MSAQSSHRASRARAGPRSQARRRKKRPGLPAEDLYDGEAASAAAAASGANVSLSALRNTVRNLERLLQHNDRLPADVRRDKERALAGHRADLAAAQDARRRKEMIGKYHMVRFFERQKATRILKRCRAEASKSHIGDEDYERRQRALHVAEVDLNYTRYHPLIERYQSLYPKPSENEAILDPTLDSSLTRPPMWKTVEEAMATGALERLRNRPSTEYQKLLLEARDAEADGTLPSTAPGESGERSVRDHSSTKTQSRKRPESEPVERMDDTQSDGGFFEDD